MSESDKEFVEQVRSALGGLPVTDKKYVEQVRSVLGSLIPPKMYALALRGAETQWRPIEEALDDEIIIARRDDGRTDIWLAANCRSLCFSRFIPLSALGEPK